MDCRIGLQELDACRPALRIGRLCPGRFEQGGGDIDAQNAAILTKAIGQQQGLTPPATADVQRLQAGLRLQVIEQRPCDGFEQARHARVHGGPVLPCLTVPVLDLFFVSHSEGHCLVVRGMHCDMPVVRGGWPRP